MATREDIARSMVLAPPPVESPQVKGKRILIIDDEPMVANSISRILRKNHRVTSTTSGSEAMQLLSGDPTFDLILCDMMMPSISGMDFVKQIPNLRLDKPIEPSELIRIVNELMID